jgi:hypothetical protein
MCKCLLELDEKLREKTGDPWAPLEDYGALTMAGRLPAETPFGVSATAKGETWHEKL